MTAPTPAPLTDLSDAGLIAAIEADQIATRILAPEVQVEIHWEPDAIWGISRYSDPDRCGVVTARFADADADRRIAEIASPRWKQVANPAPHVWMHHLEVRAVTELDDEVAAWRAEAASRAADSPGRAPT